MEESQPYEPFKADKKPEVTDGLSRRQRFLQIFGLEHSPFIFNKENASDNAEKKDKKTTKGPIRSLFAKFFSANVEKEVITGASTDKTIEPPIFAAATETKAEQPTLSSYEQTSPWGETNKTPNNPISNLENIVSDSQKTAELNNDLGNTQPEAQIDNFEAYHSSDSPTKASPYNSPEVRGHEEPDTDEKALQDTRRTPRVWYGGNYNRGYQAATYDAERRMAQERRRVDKQAEQMEQELQDVKKQQKRFEEQLKEPQLVANQEKKLNRPPIIEREPVVRLSSKEAQKPDKLDSQSVNDRQTQAPKEFVASETVKVAEAQVETLRKEQKPEVIIKEAPLEIERELSHEIKDEPKNASTDNKVTALKEQADNLKKVQQKLDMAQPTNSKAQKVDSLAKTHTQLLNAIYKKAVISGSLTAIVLIAIAFTIWLLTR